MRNGVAAIVPLFFAITLLFMFIMFMGGAIQNLEHVSNLEHVKNVQKRIVVGAMIMKIKLLEENSNLNSPLSEDQMNSIIGDKISLIMQNSNIEEE